MFSINAKPKRILTSWIWENIADINFGSAYDAFSGNGAVSSFLKRKGFQMYASDILQCGYYWNKALVENNNIFLSPPQQAAFNVYQKDLPTVLGLFKAWAGQYFTADECNWLGSWFYNINQPKVDDPHRAMGYIGVFWTMDYWLSFNRQMLGEKPMTPPEAFAYYMQMANKWAFDNQQENLAYWGDAYPLVSQIPADLIFMSPPSKEGFRNYDLRTYLWECWTRQATELDLENVVPRSMPPKLGETMGSPDDYVQAMDGFLKSAQGIPIWVIAYNDNSGMGRDRMLELVQKYHKIHKEAEMTIPYPSAGGVTEHKERLLVAIT